MRDGAAAHRRDRVVSYQYHFLVKTLQQVSTAPVISQTVLDTKFLRSQAGP